MPQLSSPGTNRLIPLLVMLVVCTAAAFGLQAQEATPPPPQVSDNQVVPIELTLTYPAIGNIQAVKQWKIGRLQQVIQTQGIDGDITLVIRLKNGDVLNVISPRAIVELARVSEWIANDKSRPSRAEYTERMIAFDVDDSGRLIAMASLETIRRDRNRLRRALSTP